MQMSNAAASRPASAVGMACGFKGAKTITPWLKKTVDVRIDTPIKG